MSRSSLGMGVYAARSPMQSLSHNTQVITIFDRLVDHPCNNNLITIKVINCFQLAKVHPCMICILCLEIPWIPFSDLLQITPLQSTQFVPHTKHMALSGIFPPLPPPQSLYKGVLPWIHQGP